MAMSSHMDTSPSHEDEEKDQDDVQVSIARQQAIIETMHGQLDQMAANKGKPKKRTQGGKASATATGTSSDQVDSFTSTRQTMNSRTLSSNPDKPTFFGRSFTGRRREWGLG